MYVISEDCTPTGTFCMKYKNAVSYCSTTCIATAVLLIIMEETLFYEQLSI